MPDESNKTKEESQIQQQNLESLGDASSNTRASSGLEDVLKTIVEKATKLIGANSSTIMLYDTYKDPLKNDTENPQLVKTYKQLLSSDNVSELAIPLKSGEDIIGVLNIESAAPHVFTNDDEKLLEHFASQAVIAIKYAQLPEETQKKLVDIWQNHLITTFINQMSTAVSATSNGKDYLDNEKESGISRKPNKIDFDLEKSTFSVRMTPDILINIIIPYIRAISQLQGIINEINAKEFSEIYIKSISQNSPISVSLDGASEAIQLIRDIITPWRSKHIKELASLLEREKLYEIECKKAEILEKHALAEKSRKEAKKISVEMDKQREEVERMKLENERMRINMHREKIKLALEVLKYISPSLSETEKIAYVVKILEPLDVLVMNDISISLTDRK